MLNSTRHRLPTLFSRLPKVSPSLRWEGRSASTTDRSSDKIPTNSPIPPKTVQNVSESDEIEIDMKGVQSQRISESVKAAEEQRSLQAPNRKETWSRSQQAREKAMVGPRFEQTVMGLQPQPYAAIELIHKQPVTWTDKRVVSCDGGGGPLGHPRIFINVDKPQINFCTYCGLPFAHHKHKAHLESLPSTTYPLHPQGNAAEVTGEQKVSDEVLAQR